MPEPTLESTSTRLLAGKTCVVMGIQNQWSIAYAIAEAMAAAGARLALTYVDDRAKRDADKLIERHPDTFGYAVDVESDDALAAFGEGLARDLGRVDCLVHSIGFAPAAAMQNPFLETTRDDFRTALSISAYSLVSASRVVVPLMPEGGSIMTLTYLGSERIFPPYRVMGVAKAALEASVRYLAGELGERRIRVNAISAGPIRTAAARGIAGFGDMQGALLDKAPLKAPFGAADVAKAAVFLASDLSASVSGDILFVDNGYHALGM